MQVPNAECGTNTMAVFSLLANSIITVAQCLQCGPQIQGVLKKIVIIIQSINLPSFFD